MRWVLLLEGSLFRPPPSHHPNPLPSLLLVALYGLEHVAAHAVILKPPFLRSPASEPADVMAARAPPPDILDIPFIGSRNAPEALVSE